MKHIHNKKPMLLAATLAVLAPMAMAQEAAKPVKADAGVAAQVNAAHDQAAQMDTQAEAQTQATPPTTPPTPTTLPTGDATKAAADAQAAQASGEKNWSDLDSNGNGTLSASEAQAMPSLSKIFTEADANADGELSQDEYKAWLASNNAARAKAESESLDATWYPRGIDRSDIKTVVANGAAQVAPLFWARRIQPLPVSFAARHPAQSRDADTRTPRIPDRPHPAPGSSDRRKPCPHPLRKEPT